MCFVHNVLIQLGQRLRQARLMREDSQVGFCIQDRRFDPYAAQDGDRQSPSVHRHMGKGVGYFGVVFLTWIS